MFFTRKHFTFGGFMENVKRPNMGEGNVKSLLLKMAIPAVLAQVVNLLYNIVDRIYIGHMPEVGDLAFLPSAQKPKTCRQNWIGWRS